MNNETAYFLFSDGLGVTPTALHEVFGVPMKTINNGMSRFKKKKSNNWGYVLKDNTKQILLKTIPKLTLEKYRISLETSCIIKKINKTKEVRSEVKAGEELEILNEELQKFCTVEWPRSVDNYLDLKFLVRKLYAQAECALNFVIKKINDGVSWELLHEVMKLNCRANEDKGNTLKLFFRPGKTVEYFKEKTERGVKEGFRSILVHGNHGKESKKKIPEEAKELVIAKITNDRGFTLTKIAEDMAKEAKFKVSYRTIRRIFKEKEELAIAANKGLKDYEINRAPYFKSTKKPGNIGDYAESDGSRYGFVSKDKFGNVVFERFYSIIDGHSGLATGCIGPSENEDLTLATFKIFVKRYGFLHREIRHDGASAHTSDRFKKFKEMSSNMGVVWRPSSTSTDLSLVERYHSTFTTRIGNGKDFFIGEGVKSKRERCRPSPNMIALYRNAENLITQEELHALYYANEREFNNDVIKGKKNNTLSAQVKWNRSTPDNAVKINPVDFILLFGEVKKPTVQKGVISFTVDADHLVEGQPADYSYSIYRKDILEKVNFEKVLVRFDLSDMSKAYLFFAKDDEFISTIYPSPSGEKATFAQTDEGRQNLKIHSDQKEVLMDGIKAELEHYKGVYDRYQESIVPPEMLSPHDDKDLIDKANRDYFMRTAEGVSKATQIKHEKKKKKGKDRTANSRNLPASLRADPKKNAKNYR